MVPDTVELTGAVAGTLTVVDTSALMITVVPVAVAVPEWSARRKVAPVIVKVPPPMFRSATVAPVAVPLERALGRVLALS